MSDTGEPSALHPGSRILHVVADASGVVGEAAAAAAAQHLDAGFRVGIAASQQTFAALELPARHPDLVHIDMSLRRTARLGDCGSAFTLHQHYRHVDVVHAHGLHAAALAGLGMTGLPRRLRPALVSTIGRAGGSAFGSAESAIVERTSAAVLGTTAPVCDHYEGAVPLVERARLLHADTGPAPRVLRDRREIRSDLGVPAGAWLIAVPIELSDHAALTAVIDAAVHMRRNRPDRRWAFVLCGEGRLRALLDEEIVSRRDDIILADGVSSVDICAGADVVIASDRMSAMTPEALMHLGRPVVHLGTARGARVWGDAVEHVAEDDAQGLMQTLGALIADPAARGRAGIAVRRRVDDVNGPELLGAELLELYAASLPLAR